MSAASTQFHSMDVSVVVIGRNEGVRLQRCLESVRNANWHGLNIEIIYVDSGSSDSSVAAARRCGARVFVLEDASPCAAKARNLGWKNAQAETILFLDGDTELVPGFVMAAWPLLSDSTLCAIWGHRRESHPEQSVYTRVLDLDWIYPVGETPYFGGDVLVRRQALLDVNGFDPELKAGEEPEMCARMRAKGWRILHIDEPMTRHDLDVNNLRAWALRCYRSGIAYAEVAKRMKVMGDPMWQDEARRDLMHGGLYILTLVMWPVLLWLSPGLAVAMLLVASGLVTRTAVRSRWKSTDRVTVCFYALHSHVQKIPSFLGQLAWYKAQRHHTVLELVEYKSSASSSTKLPEHVELGRLKLVLAISLTWAAKFHRRVWQPWQRMWAYAQLREAMDGNLSPSCVVLANVELHGTRQIRIGHGALIYPGVYLETQGEGVIEVGNRVVLSRGVHIVAFERVVIGDDCLVGEYTSIRDANHRTGTQCTRESGHDSAPIMLGNNVWLGRGVTVLKGCSLGDNVVVGANAVVTRSLPAHSMAVGIPARAVSNSIA